MHDVGLARQLRQLADGADRKAGGRDLEVLPRAVYHVAFEIHACRARVAAEREHGVVHAKAAGTHAHLADGLFHPAPRVGIIGFVEVQYAHGRSPHAASTCR